MKILSLFSGIGAFEEALKILNVEFELVNYCEFDETPAKAYSLIHNVDINKNLGDITKVDETILEDFDLMTYGFPCQSFSIQGKRLGFDDPEKGNLFFESIRIAKYKKPKIMIAENVKGLTNHDNGNTFKTILKTLEDIGYNNYYKILNSSNFGVPQNRERIYIISIRKDIDNHKFLFPNNKEITTCVNDILDLDRPRKTCKQSLLKYMDEKYFTQNYNSSTGIKKLFDGCAEGYFSSSFCANRIFSIYGVSPTLTTKNDSNFYEICGELTSRERFALQGFKKEYCDLLIENGFKKGKLDKMSGNSITVNVLIEIFKNILKTNLLHNNN